ncbi:MAG: DUF1822 family protein, partial [Leptolyngbyaceae bacterium]|nr:DUF1822 family protein [Leptolyngbyaceae bacterium]
MTPNVNDDEELMLWEELSGSEIELSATDLTVAAHRSTLVAHPQQQWQVYLHTLAVQGVKEWFTEWAADVSVSDTECSIFHPPLASLIDTACNLQVGDMTVCVIASGYLPSPGILISRVALELPGFMPHYYV